MEDFISLISSPGYLIILAAFAIGILRNNLLKKTNQKYVVWFLAVPILFELVSLLLDNNEWLYNLFDLLFFAFFFYWFYNVLDKKRLVVWCAFFFLVGFLFSVTTENYLKEFWTIGPLVGSICTLTLVIKYYIELLQIEEVVEFWRNASFWITTGLLIYNIGYLPIQFFISNGQATDYSGLFDTIAILNIVMYSFIIIGLLCPQKILK